MFGCSGCNHNTLNSHCIYHCNYTTEMKSFYISASPPCYVILIFNISISILELDNKTLIMFIQSINALPSAILYWVIADGQFCKVTIHKNRLSVNILANCMWDCYLLSSSAAVIRDGVQYDIYSVWGTLTRSKTFPRHHDVQASVRASRSAASWATHDTCHKHSSCVQCSSSFRFHSFIFA